IIEVFWEEGKLHLSPDRAIVYAGTVVKWELRVVNLRPYSRRLMWTVYFSSGSPFPGESSIFRVSPRSPQELVAAGPALRPGDWKYGVRLEEIERREVLADDDPLLT